MDLLLLYISRGVFPRHTLRRLLNGRDFTGTQHAHGNVCLKRKQSCWIHTLINILNTLCLLALMEQSFAPRLM